MQKRVWICKGLFDNDKVRDHCHFTGKYRGATQYICNLQFKKPKATPVIFQNLANYDSHLFVKNRGKSEFNIKRIPDNEGKYIGFNKDVAVVNFGKKEGKEVKDKNELHFLDIDKSVSNLSLEKL